MTPPPPPPPPAPQPPPPSTSLPLKCSPSQHIVAPCCLERFQSISSRDWGVGGWGGLKKKPTRGIPGKKKSPRVRVKNEISSEKAQCDVFLCVRVTPSINPEVNLDVRYKAQLQRKGEEGAYSNLQRREKLGILLFSCLKPLFLFDTPVATAIGFECFSQEAKERQKE